MDTQLLRQRLEEAERHIDEGKRLLRKQCQIILELEVDGHDSSRARALLHTLEHTQILNIADRDRIREEMKNILSDQAV